MNENEIAYLKKFRALAETKAKITAMIGDLSCICDSLKSWQKTAEELSRHVQHTNHPEWSDDRLKELIVLRSLLVVYHQQTEELRREWNQLKANERLGLAEPGAV